MRLSDFLPSFGKEKLPLPLILKGLKGRAYFEVGYIYAPYIIKENPPIISKEFVPTKLKKEINKKFYSTFKIKNDETK